MTGINKNSLSAGNFPNGNEIENWETQTVNCNQEGTTDDVEKSSRENKFINFATTEIQNMNLKCVDVRWF